jgi:hypothetical protein
MSPTSYRAAPPRISMIATATGVVKPPALHAGISIRGATQDSKALYILSADRTFGAIIAAAAAHMAEPASGLPGPVVRSWNSVAEIPRSSKSHPAVPEEIRSNPEPPGAS